MNSAFTCLRHNRYVHEGEECPHCEPAQDEGGILVPDDVMTAAAFKAHYARKPDPAPTISPTNMFVQMLREHGFAPKRLQIDATPWSPPPPPAPAKEPEPDCPHYGLSRASGAYWNIGRALVPHRAIQIPLRGAEDCPRCMKERLSLMAKALNQLIGTASALLHQNSPDRDSAMEVIMRSHETLTTEMQKWGTHW